MIRNMFVLSCVTASIALAQGLTATSPLVALPGATFGGSGIPNTSVAVLNLTNGPNSITLGLNATARFAAPTVTDNGQGTFFATPGIGAPNRALWNFNFFAKAVNTADGTTSALNNYVFDLLYDMNPGSFTPQSQLGRLQITGFVPSADWNPVGGVMQNSQNLGFGFYRVPVAPFITPPAGYQDPGGLPFDFNALGHYTFALRVFDLAGNQLGQVVIHVSTSGAILPNPDQSYQVRYLSNLNVGDSVINMTNSGARGADLAAGTSANTTGAICVNAYAFSPDEQMVSCCSCPVTPNGLVSLSAQQDLISNTLTPAVPTSIVVKLVASTPIGGSCVGSAAIVSPLTAIPQPGQLAPGLHAWATTVHGSTTGPQTTETAFSPATLSIAPAQQGIGELERLTRLCSYINANGSGFGICRSCRLGGLGAGRL